MWPPGHLAVGYLLYAAVSRLRGEAPSATPALVVCFASLLPDLVDKPLAWYLGVLPTGRTLGHSLLVVGPVAAVVFLLARRAGRTEEGIAFGIGLLSHPLVDALPALWDPNETGSFLLWPLLPVEPYPEGAPDPIELLLAQAGDPYFLLEFLLLGVALVVWRRDGYPGMSTEAREAH